MINIGICDDDKFFSFELKEYLLKYACNTDIHMDIALFFDSKELFTGIKERGIFDLLFLDIQLKTETGIDVGRKLRSDINNETMQIVFISAKESYAMQLFDLRPMNFLVKPINYNKIEFIMNEYKRLYKFENPFFRYHIRKQEYQINERYIQYFQSFGKKILMVTLDDVIEFYGKLSEITSRIKSYSFCKVHKSYIINMNYVVKYCKNSIEMVNGDIIPISRSMRQNVNKKLLEMMKEV